MRKQFTHLKEMETSAIGESGALEATRILVGVTEVLLETVFSIYLGAASAAKFRFLT